MLDFTKTLKADEPLIHPSCVVTNCTFGAYVELGDHCIANETHLERFTAAFSGAVNAVFRGGFEEYVSRRCFTQIKRRLSK